MEDDMKVTVYLTYIPGWVFDRLWYEEKACYKDPYSEDEKPKM